MKLLIVAATNEEINPLLLWIEHFPNQHKNLHIDILTTGIGMVNTALQMGNILAWDQYDLAINCGIAGSFVDKFKNGTVVRITNDCFADFGVMDKKRFKTFFETGMIPKNDFPFTNGKLIPAKSTLTKTLKKLKTAKAVTVNTVSGNVDEIKKLKTKFKCETESLEGAAFFQACIQNDLPCQQIRSISNKVKSRNKKDWDIPLAVSNLNHTMIEVLKDLNERVRN